MCGAARPYPYGVSQKTLCPVCSSYTSAITAAVQDNHPCPYCGTSADVIWEVNLLRGQRADEQLKARVEELLVELGKVAADRDRLAGIVEGVRSALDG